MFCKLVDVCFLFWAGLQHVFSLTHSFLFKTCSQIATNSDVEVENVLQCDTSVMVFQTVRMAVTKALAVVSSASIVLF